MRRSGIVLGLVFLGLLFTASASAAGPRSAQAAPAQHASRIKPTRWDETPAHVGAFAPPTPSASTSGITYGPNLGKRLDISRVGSLVVDDADGYVFITGGSVPGQPFTLEVYTTGGNRVSAPGLTDEAGADGMVLAGGALYVGRCVEGKIDVIDPTTLTRTETIPITSSTLTNCPLAVAGGRLWYQAANGSADGPLTSVSLTTPRVFDSYPELGQWGDLTFATTAAAPNLLVVSRHWPDATIPNQGIELDVSAQTPTVVSSGSWWQAGTLSPDGTTLIGDDGAITSYTLPDLSTQTMTYPSPGGRPALPDVSFDGKFLAFGSEILSSYGGTSQSPDVLVYPIGSTTPQRTWRLPEAAAQVTGTVAYNSTATKLYDVTYGNELARLHILAGPNEQQAELDLTPSHRAIVYGRSDMLTVHLSAWSTNRQVKVWSQPYGSRTAKLVTTVTVNATSGDASVTVTPKRNTAYWATSDGDAVYGGSNASDVRWVGVHVKVSGALSKYYAVRDGVHLYHSGVRPVYTARLQPVHPGSCMVFVLEVHRSSGWYYVQKCFAMHRGYAAVSIGGLRVGKRYRILAGFDDADHMVGRSGWAYFTVTR